MKVETNTLLRFLVPYLESNEDLRKAFKVNGAEALRIFLPEAIESAAAELYDIQETVNAYFITLDKVPHDEHPMDRAIEKQLCERWARK